MPERMQDPLADFSQHGFPLSAKELTAYLETHVFPLEALLSAGRHEELAAGIAAGATGREGARRVGPHGPA
jgi:hypothetical protein